MNDLLLAKVRTFREADIAYIGNSLMNSYAYEVSGAPRAIEPTARKSLIREELKESVAPIWVACDLQDEDLIMGWLWGEPPLLHYVFVREEFRGKGIALQLLAPFASSRTIFCSHWTKSFKNFARGRHLYRRIL